MKSAKTKSESHIIVSNSVTLHCSTPDSVYSDSSGKNTEVDSCSLPQGIFPTQGLIQVSHIAGRFFTNWSTREAL